MIALTALSLFIIGLLNCFKLSVKSDKLICGVSLFSLLGLIFWYASRMLNFKEQIFSYLWNSSPSGDIKIDILSNAYNCQLFLPFLIITFLAVCGNYCFRYEEKRCKYNALLLFNLIILLLMITSNNFVQLLSAVFLIDIFAVISARNTQTCKKFIMANLLADMVIFMLLALINGRIDSLDIRQVINYKNMGYHIDFITILGFTTILLKMGFFPFQISLTSLDELRFHRLINILCLFSPISALILLLKFHSLWSSSTYFLPYLDGIFPIVIVWSSICALLSDNFRRKIIYWQIMFFALLIELLRFHGFVWDVLISKLVLADYILLSGISLLYYQSGRKNNLSLIINNVYRNKAGIFLAFFVISLAIFALIHNLEEIYNNRNRYYIWSYAALFLISFCEVLHQICLTTNGKELSNSVVWQKPLKLLFLILLTCTGITLLTDLNFQSYVFWIMSAIFLTLTLTGINPHIRCIYRNKSLQNIDFFDYLYRTFFVKILQSSGRLLWLIIDWKLVEKLITGMVIGIWQTGLRIFRNLQVSIIWRCLFIIITILAALEFVPFFREIR